MHLVICFLFLSLIFSFFSYFAFIFFFENSPNHSVSHCFGTVLWVYLLCFGIDGREGLMSGNKHVILIYNRYDPEQME